MIAAELMTDNPRTVRPTDTIAEALEAFQSMDIRHLPVVDDRNNLIGMLSDRDLGALVKLFAEGAEAERMAVPLSQRRVADAMSADVVSVDADADVLDVIDTLIEQRVGAVPVIDDEGYVVGIISYVDLLRAYAAELEPSARPAGTRRERAR